MNERLKLIRESLRTEDGKKISQTRFAEEMHISRDILANYESGRVIPTDLFISTLCEKYGVREEWLRSGEGEMYIPMNRDKELAKFTEDLYQQNPSENTLKLMRMVSHLSEEDIQKIFDIICALLDEFEKSSPD